MLRMLLQVTYKSVVDSGLCTRFLIHLDCLVLMGMDAEPFYLNVSSIHMIVKMLQCMDVIMYSTLPLRDLNRFKS